MYDWFYFVIKWAGRFVISLPMQLIGNDT
jgi:hypothetical protein